MNLEKSVIDYIEKIFEGDFSGHDFWHSMRVYKNAMRIAEWETCNQCVVMLGSLLHDVDDKKLFKTKNYENARKIMNMCDINENMSESVIEAISTVSYQGKDSVVPKTIEGKIVQDADRLDAIGAIGIARTFAFGGSRRRSIYHPNIQPRMDLDESDYKTYEGTTINHFYEKLFLLKDGMNTETAKKIAEQRDSFMHQFIDEFYDEWNGKR